MIGCGQKTYEASLANPKLVFDRLLLSKYTQWAEKVHDEWQEELRDSEEKTQLLTYLHNFYKTKHLTNMYQEETINQFLNGAEEIQKLKSIN